jgi:ATP-dependent DNA helicase PIF1
LSGDFYQLPPVGDDDDEDTTAFCFESEAWGGIDDICKLNTIKRQDDQNFVKILNQVRVGRITKSTIATLTSRIDSEVSGDLKPTVMFPRRFHADQVNNREYKSLPDGEEFLYKRDVVDDANDLSANDRMIRAMASPDVLDHEVKYLSSGTMAEQTIRLKVGTQVMCIANIDMDSEHQIVNGSQGIVIGFQGGLPNVQFRSGIKKLIGKHIWQSETLPGLSIQQIPLIYSWAITIHKAQGVTLEVAEIDAGSHIFECGQTYVALSRVKNIEGLRLTSFDYKKIRINKKVKDFYSLIV